MNDTRIVVFDPTHELNEGTLVEGSQKIAKLERSRVVLLPVDADRINRSIDGYFRRSWGTGWEYDRMAGERGCPMLLGVDSQRLFIYWAVRLAAVDPKPQGTLKLTTDSSGQRAMSGGLSAEVRVPTFDHLGPPDSDGGWIIGGRSRLTTAVSGVLSLCLYGVARRTRVLWSAVSQSRIEVNLPFFVE